MSHGCTHAHVCRCLLTVSYLQCQWVQCQCGLDQSSFQVELIGQECMYVLYKLFSAPSPSPDGQYVAVGSSDGSLFVWDTIGGKKKREKCKEHRCENM